MTRRIESRRDFLKQASVALALPLAFGCRLDSSAQVSSNTALDRIRANANTNPSDDWWGARHAPADVSWRTRLSGKDDKAEKIVIGGTVYKPDGQTAAANTLIYLYHTDVFGIYGREGEPRHGRYRGWMLTDARGRYEFESILPASYPNSTIAKHIHMTVTTEDKREDWVDSILFDGDKFLTSRDRQANRGGFDPVLKLVKENEGVMRGVRDIRLWV
jgi:protocatechuate 3,4-dioxygenase beta subunit